jgi:hypothetical protein
VVLWSCPELWLTGSLTNDVLHWLAQLEVAKLKQFVSVLQAQPDLLWPLENLGNMVLYG